MYSLTIGVRGRGVLISSGTGPNFRLVKPARARRYARLLLEAAAAAEAAARAEPPTMDDEPPKEVG